MNYIFLLLSVFLFLIPFFLSLDQKIFILGKIRPIIPAVLVTTIVFSVGAVFFTIFGVWIFNPKYLIGIYYKDVPLEQYLFFFAFSFAALGIYNYLNAKFQNNYLQRFSLAVSNLILGICVAFIFFAYAKWYTVVTFSILFLLLLYIEYLNKLRFMYRFYRAYVVCLVLFYVCYGLICNLPIIQYQATETIKLNLANIPLENHFYMMGMFLLEVYLFEFFKNREAK